MRFFVLSAVAVSFILFSGSSFAAEVCAGGCDRYGNPVYNVAPDNSRERVGDRFGDERYVPDEEFDNPRIDTPPPLPRYVRRRHSGSRYYRHRHHQRRSYRRSYRKYRSHRRYRRPVYRDRYAGRTEFCRTHREYRNGHKVNVKRCVWVRNDLVPNYAEGTRYSDDW